MWECSSYKSIEITYKWGSPPSRMQISMQSINHMVVPLPHRAPKQSESNVKMDMGHFQSKLSPNASSNPAIRWTSEENYSWPNAVVHDSEASPRHVSQMHIKCIIYQGRMHQSQEENRQMGMGLEYFSHFCNHMQLNEFLAMPHIICRFRRRGGPMSECQLSVAIVHTINLTLPSQT